MTSYKDHVRHSPEVFPKDILKALSSDKTCLRHWKGFAMSYRRIRVAWVESKRSEPQAARGISSPDKALAWFSLQFLWL